MPSEPSDASEAEADCAAGDEFTYQVDGTVTARHLGTGIVASGSSYAEALVELTAVLAGDEHDAEPIEDPEAFLENLGLPRFTDRGNE